MVPTERPVAYPIYVRLEARGQGQGLSLPPFSRPSKIWDLSQQNKSDDLGQISNWNYRRGL